MATKPLAITEIPSRGLVTADDDSNDGKSTYATAVNQWKTVHKKHRVVPTKLVQKGSAIVGSARNVAIRAAKLSDLHWTNVFASRLDPNLTAVQLKAYLDSSLTLDVLVEQVKPAR